MANRVRQYSGANLPVGTDAYRRKQTFRFRLPSLKTDADKKAAMLKILGEQVHNALYHDEKKRQELIAEKTEVKRRALVPLPPSDSLDQIQKFKKYAGLAALAVSALGYTLLGLAVIGLLMWILYWNYSPNVDYLYPPKAKTFGKQWIENPRTPLGMLNIFPLFMGSWCLSSGTFFRNQLIKNYFLVGPWFLLIPAFHVALSCQVYAKFRNYSPDKQMRRDLSMYASSKVSQSIWDFNQIQFECCGLTSFNDWNPNNQTYFRVPFSCCPDAIPQPIMRKRVMSRGRRVEQTPDCPPYNLTTYPSMAANFSVPIVWRRGCLYMVIDHFYRIGAFTVTFSAIIFAVTVASMIVARMCYIYNRSMLDLGFKYTWRDTVCDMFGRRLFRFIARRNSISQDRAVVISASEDRLLQPKREASVASFVVVPEIIVTP